MAVGVLALQGSFREHIACEFCFSVILFTKKYKEIFTSLLFHASVGICRVLLQVLGIPGCEL
jgi:glutamine amidotransferase PdxT